MTNEQVIEMTVIRLKALAYHLSTQGGNTRDCYTLRDEVAEVCRAIANDVQTAKYQSQPR